MDKQWVAQTTINFADDEELLSLAAEAGCVGVFIGFESPTPDGLAEVGKKYNLAKGRDFPAAVARVQRHKIMVVGSFMIGLDVDGLGAGVRVAHTASHYGVDNLNVSFLTPLPGTKLWDEMKAKDRIPLSFFPEDWKYYTLTYPAARYKQLTLAGVTKEMTACNRDFYSGRRILSRMVRSVRCNRSPLFSLVHNLSSRRNSRLLSRAYASFGREEANRFA